MSAVPGRPQLTLIHGWGSSSTTWKPLLPRLQETCDLTFIDLPGFGGKDESGMEYDNVLTFNDLLNQIVCRLPEESYVLGWSLGGMLATQIAAQYPGRVKGLITLATNPSFVASETWPWAMARQTYLDFCNNFIAAPGATFKRFCSLQAQGDEHRKAVVKTLTSDQAPPEKEQEALWFKHLCFLEQINNTSSLHEISCPALHFFGEHDSLVPVSACENGFAGLAQHKTKIVKETGHALHISRPDTVSAAVLEFIEGGEEKRKYLKNKVLIAQAFDKAAKKYDEAAGLQKRVAEKLVDFSGELYGEIVDLGSGTGFVSQNLSGDNIQTIYLLDISKDMLIKSKEKMCARQETRFLSCDMEQLPLENDSVDKVVSSMSVQWSDNFPQVLSEIKRVLKMGGEFAFSTVGPGTLNELASAWKETDSFVHVNQFQTLAMIIDQINDCGFEIKSTIEKTDTLFYENIHEVMRSIKDVGAHNVNAGQNKGLTGRKALAALQNAYDKYRNRDGLLPATWEIFYFVLRKVH